MPDLFQKYPDIKDEILQIHKIDQKDVEQLCLLFPYPLSLKQAGYMLKRFETSFQEGNAMILGVYQDDLIGVIEIYHVENDTAEIGYRTILQKQHLGLTKHALKMMVEYLMNADMKWIEAYVDEKNIASIKVLEANGFQRCGNKDRGLRYIKEK